MFPDINVSLTTIIQKCLLLLTALLIHGFQSAGQDDNTLKDFQKALNSRSFMMLQEQVGAHGGNWAILRSLTGDFMEGVLKLDYKVKDASHPTYGKNYAFTTNVIIKGTRIIYCKMEDDYRAKSGSNENALVQPVCFFRDEQAYNELKRLHASVFHSALNDSNLCRTDVRYGYACGIQGNGPDERNKMEIFIVNRDRESLARWLRSGHLEKQIYAIEGLLRLKGLGIQMTEEETTVMRYILSKNATISFCQGCGSSLRPVSEIARLFTF